MSGLDVVPVGAVWKIGVSAGATAADAENANVDMIANASAARMRLKENIIFAPFELLFTNYSRINHAS